MSIIKEKIEIPAITLPEDQYGHYGAPTEWWWHVGTLTSADGRKFGFEINATGKASYAFTQIEIIDLQNQCKYQKVNPIIDRPEDWTEYDQSKPWYVKLFGPLADPNDGAVSMKSIGGNPLDMKVDATFTDSISKKKCELNLSLYQEGPPLLIFGTGCHEVNKNGTTPLTRNNYYYSLTNLKASGSIKIGDEKIEVTGLTWMDHEYGYFPDGSTEKVIWLLQDMQLGDGLHLSNFTKFGVEPKANVPMKSNATILLHNGKSIFVASLTTPLNPVFTSDKKIDYFLKFKVEVHDPELTATFFVNSLSPDQLFNDGKDADVYEGVGDCHASYGTSDMVIRGTAWIEQNLG